MLTSLAAMPSLAGLTANILQEELSFCHSLTSEVPQTLGLPLLLHDFAMKIVRI
jgi:hypothetical protein